MTASRRDFIKLFGISLVSLLLARCRWRNPLVSCYLPMVPEFTATPEGNHLDTLERLRMCWLRLGELAQVTSAGARQGNDNREDKLEQQMIADHRAALDELVVAGEISSRVADLVQEAYTAAVYHVWRSNVAIICYDAVVVDYAPASADALVRQMEVLREIAGQGTLDPETLAKVRAALEHDMAFYALSETDVQALYDRLLEDYREDGRQIPSFETLQLEITPEAKAAAQFILELLAGK